MKKIALSFVAAVVSLAFCLSAFAADPAPVEKKLINGSVQIY